MSYIKYIQDAEHYNEVLSKVGLAKESVWIATADLKDLYVKKGLSVVPFLAVLNNCIEKGVAVNLLYAKEPGSIFKKDFEKFPRLKKELQLRQCVRVHLKMIIIDGGLVYLGSANLTGAGLGMKGSNQRNFEAGILTNSAELTAKSELHYYGIWSGKRCKTCKRKQYCPQPIG